MISSTGRAQPPPRLTQPLEHGRAAVRPTDDDRPREALLEYVGLTPILRHECRHTYASLMIAAGVSPNALSTYMGRSTITLTLDRYGHLLPGNETEAANLLDNLLREPEHAAPLHIAAAS